MVAKKALLVLALALLSSCATFHPQPLSPAQTAVASTAGVLEDAVQHPLHPLESLPAVPERNPRMRAEGRE